MPKYHVNPETNKIGECKAKIKCAFNIDDDHHFSSKSDAQKFVEQTTQRNSETFFTLSKSNKNNRNNFQPTPEEYFKTIETTLDIIRDSIITCNAEEMNLIIPNELGTRNGSAQYEEVIKRAINSHYNEILENINEKLIKLGSWKVEKIHADLNNSEAANRTPYDILIELKHPGDNEPHKEWINIKASAGSTSDNIGGWAVLGAICFGAKANIINRKSFIEYLKTHKINSENTDYHLWVFDKSLSGIDSIKSGRVFSLLKTDPGAFIYNGAQTFPLQFNYHKAKVENTQTGNILERKKKFIKNFIQKDNEYFIKRLQQNKDILDLINDDDDAENYQ